MYNIYLDRLPQGFEGYLIRTDYRIGVQISQALEDDELSQQERLAQALYLLYGEGIPEIQVAIDGLRWFLSGGDVTEKAADGEADTNGDGIDFFSFEYDAGRIYTAFRRAYGVDLSRVTMHWFEFLTLMGDLGDCAFTQVVEYRTADLSRMDKETKKAYQKMRKKYALPQQESEEAQKFMELLEGGEKETGCSE